VKIGDKTVKLQIVRRLGEGWAPLSAFRGMFRSQCLGHYRRDASVLFCKRAIIISAFSSARFPPHYFFVSSPHSATVSPALSLLSVSESLQWDTAGQERFRTITSA
jgi:hypothetical protein